MHTFKVTPDTQVSESWTVNELLHYRDKMNWKTISYRSERVWGDSGRERTSIFFSFNYFPCSYSYLCHLEHSVPVTGFIIWTIHVFFKHALFDPCSKCCAETTYFSGLTLSAGLSMIRNHVSHQSNSVSSPMHCFLCYHVTAVDGSLKVLYCCYV